MWFGRRQRTLKSHPVKFSREEIEAADALYAEILASGQWNAATAGCEPTELDGRNASYSLAPAIIPGEVGASVQDADNDTPRKM